MAITYINYIPQGDGTYVDFETLSEEEKEVVRDKITTRMMETLGYRKVAKKGAENESTKEKSVSRG